NDADGLRRDALFQVLADVTPSVQRFVSVLEVFRSRVVRVFVWQTAGNQAWPRALVSCRADTPRPRHRSLRGAAARPAAPGPRSLDDLALPLLKEACPEDQLRARLADGGGGGGLPPGPPPSPPRPMSRSTVGRILTEADLKPHRSAYGLTSHDPDFAVRAQQ